MTMDNQERLSPELLFEEDGHVTEVVLACLAEASFHENSAKLGECLQAQDPAVARESAAALFGTFFTLLTTFIGERLTTQALRSAWPTIEAMAPEENK